MDRFSSPVLSSVPHMGFFFCKNERIVAPLPGHQSLIPLSSCSAFHYLSLLKPQDERNRWEVVEEEERDGRYRRGLRDQVMLTGALPRPTRIRSCKSISPYDERVCGSFPVYCTYTRTSVRGNAWSRFCGIGSPRKEEEERGDEEEIKGRHIRVSLRFSLSLSRLMLLVHACASASG